VRKGQILTLRNKADTNEIAPATYTKMYLVYHNINFGSLNKQMEGILIKRTYTLCKESIIMTRHSLRSSLDSLEKNSPLRPDIAFCSSACGTAGRISCKFSMVIFMNIEPDIDNAKTRPRSCATHIRSV